MFYRSRYQQGVMGVLGAILFTLSVQGMHFKGSPRYCPVLSRTFVPEEEIVHSPGHLEIESLYRLQKKMSDRELKQQAHNILLGKQYGKTICSFGTDYVYIFYQKKKRMGRAECEQLQKELYICLDDDCNRKLKEVINDRGEALRFLELKDVPDLTVGDIKRAYKRFMEKNDRKKPEELYLKDKHAQMARVVLTSLIAEFNLFVAIDNFSFDGFVFSDDLADVREKWMNDWQNGKSKAWEQGMNWSESQDDLGLLTSSRELLMQQGTRLIIQMISQFIHQVDEEIEQQVPHSLPASQRPFDLRFSFEGMMGASFDND